MSEDCDVTGKIYDLTYGEHRNWQLLLEFGKTLSLDEQRKFLWAWPTEANLKTLKITCAYLEIRNILSIGCGCGLLEWILRESVGISIYGLEVDKSWWTSGYAVKSFIDVNYKDASDDKVEQKNYSEYLQFCARTSDWKFAVLFCYFNNHAAFINYLKHYKGEWIIIIGPMPGVGIHTDPGPLEPEFPPETSWRLHSTLQLCDTDLVAFYTNTK